MISVLLVVVTQAVAANRTACFQFKIADDRTECATFQDAGARRYCQQGGNTINPIGMVVQLWDKDDGGSDDLIGDFIVSQGGLNCATFEWETHPNNLGGEPNPDVYVQLPFEVSDLGNVVRARQLNGTTLEPREPASWRDGPYGDEDKYVLRNCQTGGNCILTDFLIPTSNPASTMGKQVMVLDSVQHTLEVFATTFTEDVDVVMPCSAAGCDTSQAVDRRTLHIKTVDANNGRLPGHTLGHLLMMQRFERDALAFDCAVFSGSDWGLLTVEAESCSTVEGFSDFVAAVSMWDDDDYYSVPTFDGLSLEDATPVDTVTCQTDHAYPLQYAKGFWDLADTRNENAVYPAVKADTVNVGERTIAARWDEFPNGGGNREDQESDHQGPNLRDYVFNNTANFGVGFFETLVRHQCTAEQDDG